MNTLTVFSAAIPLSGVNSAAVHLAGGWFPVGVYVPATWDGGTLTLQVSQDGLTWSGVNDKDGNAWTVSSPSAGGYYSISPDVALGAAYARLVAGTAVGAIRTLKIAARLY